MSIDDYFNKVKYPRYTISKLDHTANIFEYGIRRIITHWLNPNYRGSITFVQGC